MSRYRGQWCAPHSCRQLKIPATARPPIHKSPLSTVPKPASKHLPTTASWTATMTNPRYGFILCILLVLSLFMAAPADCRPSKGARVDEILEVLKTQADAWNRGDLDAFM